MRNELLSGAAIFAIAAGLATPAHAQTITVCPSGCTATSLSQAASKITGNGFDIQFTQPGTYDAADTGGVANIGYAGTVENVYSSNPADVTVAMTTQAGQAMVMVGAKSGNPVPWPSVNVTFKGFTFNGAVTGGTKQARCVQFNAPGALTAENMAFNNCQDGILGNNWIGGTPAGSITVVNSSFNNDGSPNGPSHCIYAEVGTLTVQGSTFTNTNYGYAIKTRAPYNTITGNNFSRGFNGVVPGAQIQIANRGTATVSGNIFNDGPSAAAGGNGGDIYIGLELIAAQNPLPLDINISNNTFEDNTGTPGRVIPVINEQQTGDGVLLAGNTVAATMISPMMWGPGTIGAGNVLSTGSAIAQAIQEDVWINGNGGSINDYRGTQGPISLTISSAAQSVYGGNGLLTVTQTPTLKAVGGFPFGWIIGGSGGISVNLPTGGMNIATAPGSTNNGTLAAAGINNLDYGNDTFTVSTTHGGNFMVDGGSSSYTITEPGELRFDAQDSATLNIDMNAGTAGNFAAGGIFAYSGASVAVTGTDTGLGSSGGNEYEATISVDALEPTSGHIFNASISGGSGQINFKNAGTAADSCTFAGYDNEPETPLYITIVSCDAATVYIDGGAATIDASADHGSVSSAWVSNIAGQPLTVIPGPGTMSLDAGVLATSSPLTLELGAPATGYVRATWRPTVDKALLGPGVTVVSQTASGNKDTAILSNGGTVEFDYYAAKPVTFGSITTPVDITLSAPASLTITSGGGTSLTGFSIADAWASGGSGTDTVTLTAQRGTLSQTTFTGTPAAINAAMAATTYTAPLTGGSDTITMSATNSGAGAASPVSVPVTVSWSAIWNDIQLGVPGALTVTAGQAVWLVGIIIADPLATQAGVNDTVTVTDANGLPFRVAGNPLPSPLNGSGSPSLLQALVDGATVTEPTAGTDTVTVRVTDPAGYSVTHSIPVTVNPAVVNLPTSGSVSYTSNGVDYLSTSGPAASTPSLEH